MLVYFTEVFSVIVSHIFVGLFLRVFRRRQYREFVAGLQATPWPGVPCNENLHDYNMTGG